MISQSFEYSAPRTLAEALALLAGGDAKVLAGGMSLIPMMKLRLAAPGRLVDLSRVPGLTGIREQGGALHIGAMTTHYEVESSAVLRAKCPLLAETASAIGDVQVRNMGTIGGSAAHADPAADYPAALLAVEAKVTLARKGGERTLAFSDFLIDTFTTALEPGEILTGVIVPVEPAGAGVSYQKMLQPASGFAIVGVAARVHNGSVRIGVTGLSGKAFRAAAAEKIFAETRDVQKAAAAVPLGVEANSDIHASADYRRHVAAVYAARALNAALSRAS
ncbi:MAG: xanthine dehydrogenase family protein subunit M [Acidobacteria bacterium]|nr:xanthine dehydrogenase family protein subunit M [Acidobacteriota bacterium]